MLRPKTRRDRRRSRKGAIAVVTALCLAAFLGVIALGIDGGLWMAERRKAQTAADSAALAAAAVLYERFDEERGLDPSGKAEAAALEYAEKYGYTNDEAVTPPLLQVIVEIPPTPDEGPSNPEYEYESQFVGKAGYVKVRIQTYQKRLFSAIFDGGDLFVTRRAVAVGAKPATVYSPAAVILLDPAANGSYTAAGSARLVADAGIKVNSNHGRAITANNAGSLTAPLIEVVGGTYSTSGGTINGPVQSPSEPISDPLLSVVPPNPSAQPTRSAPPLWGNGTAITIQPGLYNGGLSLNGWSKVTMEPGVYYMKGGGFSVANGVRLAGKGVMIYIDNGGGKFNFQGGGVIDLSAPESGPHTGIVMWQDRNSSQPISIANGSETTIKGTVYAAGAAMTIAGGAGISQYGSQIIARTLDISNNAKIWTTGDPNEIARRSVSLLGLVQ